MVPDGGRPRWLLALFALTLVACQGPQVPTPSAPPARATQPATPPVSPTAGSPRVSLAPSPSGGASVNQIDIAQLTGTLAFISSGDDGENIWLLRFNGTSSPTTEQLTAAEAGKSFWAPAWSPDGRRLAFQHRRDETVTVQIMDSDGTGARIVADGVATPVWSRDATQLAVSHIEPGARGIALLDIATGAVSQVTKVSDNVPEEYPAWSPDGQFLAFTSHRSGKSQIWRCRLDGTDLLQLTHDETLATGANWSPDGSRLAFTSSSTGEGDIYTINPDGTGLTQLTRGRFFEGGPAWSPDGRYILYSARKAPDSEPGDLSLWVMRSDGTGATELLDFDAEDMLARWTA